MPRTSKTTNTRAPLLTGDSNGPSGAKTKNERIRDNQRRSRAKRQEYVAKLEQNIQELQSTCRELEMRQDEWAEANMREAKLMELCSMAGYDEDRIKTYVHSHQREPVTKSLVQNIQFPGSTTFASTLPRSRSEFESWPSDGAGISRSSPSSPDDSDGSLTPINISSSLASQEVRIAHLGADHGPSCTWSPLVDQNQDFCGAPTDQSWTILDGLEYSDTDRCKWTMQTHTTHVGAQSMMYDFNPNQWAATNMQRRGIVAVREVTPAVQSNWRVDWQHYNIDVSFP